MKTLNEAIVEIQTSHDLNAETRNSLHSATEGHPWCEGKSFDERKLTVKVALAGRRVDCFMLDAVERAVK